MRVHAKSHARLVFDNPPFSLSFHLAQSEIRFAADPLKIMF